LKGCFVVVVVLVGRGGGVVVVGGGVLLLMFPNRSFQLTRRHNGSPTIVVSAKLELCSASNSQGKGTAMGAGSFSLVYPHSMTTLGGSALL